MGIEKINILGAVLELPAKQHCQSSPFTSEVGPNGLNWQCCLTGSSKTAPSILIFSIAIDADYTFELISIKTCAPQFKWLNKSFLGSVTVWRLFIWKCWVQIRTVQQHPDIIDNDIRMLLNSSDLNPALPDEKLQHSPTTQLDS